MTSTTLQSGPSEQPQGLSPSPLCRQPTAAAALRSWRRLRHSLCWQQDNNTGSQPQSSVRQPSSSVHSHCECIVAGRLFRQTLQASTGTSNEDAEGRKGGCCEGTTAGLAQGSSGSSRRVAHALHMCQLGCQKAHRVCGNSNSACSSILTYHGDSACRCDPWMQRGGETPAIQCWLAAPGPPDVSLRIPATTFTDTHLCKLCSCRSQVVRRPSPGL